MTRGARRLLLRHTAYSHIHLQTPQLAQDGIETLPLGHVRLNDQDLPILHFGLFEALLARLLDFGELVRPSSEQHDIRTGTSEQVSGRGAYTGRSARNECCAGQL